MPRKKAVPRRRVVHAQLVPEEPSTREDRMSPLMMTRRVFVRALIEATEKAHGPAHGYRIRNKAAHMLHAAYTLQVHRLFCEADRLQRANQDMTPGAALQHAVADLRSHLGITPDA